MINAWKSRGSKLKPEDDIVQRVGKDHVSDDQDRNDRGSIVVEASLVLPVFIFLLCS